MCDILENSADMVWSVHRGERLLEWTRDKDEATRRAAVQAFAQFVKTGNLYVIMDFLDDFLYFIILVGGARDFIGSAAMMDALMAWGQDSDVQLVRCAVQLIANIAIHGIN